jgi:hypothetical protein
MRICLAVLILSLVRFSSPAMDCWSALSMIESGNNDRAIGSVGEISRFQIRPELWPGGNPQDQQIALTAAQEIMQSRLNAFRKVHKRDATNFEFYILWNAPRQVDHPGRIAAARARRFANLIQH